MKLPVTAALASLLIGLPAFAETPALALADLEPVIGDDWTGELTYLNYQAPFEDVTILADLNASMTEAGLQLDYVYPNEPHANSTVIAKIGDDGMTFMGEPITANDVTSDGTRTVTTAFACEDMGRSAQCEMTYAFSATRVSIKKMVIYDGEAESFRRNAYTFTR